MRGCRCAATGSSGQQSGRVVQQAWQELERRKENGRGTGWGRTGRDGRGRGQAKRGDLDFTFLGRDLGFVLGVLLVGLGTQKNGVVLPCRLGKLGFVGNSGTTSGPERGRKRRGRRVTSDEARLRDRCEFDGARSRSGCDLLWCFSMFMRRGPKYVLGKSDGGRESGNCRFVDLRTAGGLDAWAVLGVLWDPGCRGTKALDQRR